MGHFFEFVGDTIRHARRLRNLSVPAIVRSNPTISEATLRRAEGQGVITPRTAAVLALALELDAEALLAAARSTRVDRDARTASSKAARTSSPRRHVPANAQGERKT
jgi:hypothetical protein